MTRKAFALLAAVPLLSCSGSSQNSLSGSMTQLYDPSFSNVNIVLQGQSVAIQYVNGTSGDPAVLVVDFAHIANVSGSTIDLTQLDSGQPRGVLQRISGVTTNYPLERGTVTFDQVPAVGASLSGNFATTLADPAGYTLDGDFSGTVTAP